MDRSAALILIVIVVVLWIIGVAVWRGANRRLNAWREIITKGDTAYFISEYGEKAFVTVVAVDRSRPRAIQVDLMIAGNVSAQWVKASDLYPAPTPTEDK